MLNRLLLVALLLVGLLCLGCQTTSYRWVKSGVELPADCSETFHHKHMTIDYCLVPDGESGKFYFEGFARSSLAHGRGNIRDGSFYLYLMNGREVQKKIRLFRQGNELDQKIFLSREFVFEGGFDRVLFSWNLRYAF